ncbi:hypothetical protein ACFL1D_01490 [Candidatus Omnitrophota bacterium]
MNESEARITDSFIMPVMKIADKFHYFPRCDFFSLGLSFKQIELILKNRKIPLEIYTTGLNVNIDQIKYFSSKYPDKFNVFLSIITLDPGIRKRVMNPNISIANLKKICVVLRRPIFYLLYLTKEQLISDIEYLNPFTVRNNGSFYIHKLYYNRLSPVYIKEYSDNARHDFQAIVAYLKKNNGRLENISRRISFSPEPQIYAWAWKKELKKLLSVCKGKPGEAIFCSHGAYPIIRAIINKDAHVVPVHSCFGGCVDFALGITVKAILSEIKKILRKSHLKHIYIPHTMFGIDMRLDLHLDSVDLIKKTYPRIKITIITVPDRLSMSVLSLKQCVSFYSRQNAAADDCSRQTMSGS